MGRPGSGGEGVMKLTPVMRKTLEAVNRGDVVDTGRIVGANPTSLRYAFLHGFVDWKWLPCGKYSLTKKGRKALNEGL